jgi:hypothetical protein
MWKFFPLVKRNVWCVSHYQSHAREQRRGALNFLDRKLSANTRRLRMRRPGTW